MLSEITIEISFLPGISVRFMQFYFLMILRVEHVKTKSNLRKKGYQITLVF